MREGRTAAAVSDRFCTTPKPTAVFQPVDRQVFLWFVARQVRSGEQLRVEWLDPSGAISTSADYPNLPSASELCLTTQLPIAGFAPASQPGLWTVRVVAAGSILISRNFTIAADSDSGGPVVTSVTWSGVRAQEVDFTVSGRNFRPNSLVLIAQYAQAGGWNYLASLTPTNVTSTQMVVHYPGLPANEYLVLVENPDQRMSRPMPFVIATSGYKLPIAAGEPWVITQGPYGTFSHWGNSVHAYDIAPRSGNCVVAMKAGIAYAHDLGLRQDHRHHSFGNYITIDHGNGEYSHYAHLASGTFVVKSGDHVKQGQALATAGNSGYTLGEGGGYHLHVSVTRALPISSNSIPFRLEDLPDAPRGSNLNRVVMSSNASPLCDCHDRRLASSHAGPAAIPASRQFAAQLSVAQWWNEVIAVPKGSKTFRVTLRWAGSKDDLDLHLVSPSGRHYGWYGDTSGYSGQKSNPEEFNVAQPEPGLWRISVQAVAGGEVPIEFTLDSSGQKPAPHLVASTRTRRIRAQN